MELQAYTAIPGFTRRFKLCFWIFLKQLTALISYYLQAHKQVGKETYYFKNKNFIDQEHLILL